MEGHLGPIVDDIVLSPAIIHRISEGEINDAWVKALIEFDSKFAPLSDLEKRGIKAVEDVKPQFELLKTRVPRSQRITDVGAYPDTGLFSRQDSIVTGTK